MLQPDAKGEDRPRKGGRWTPTHGGYSVLRHVARGTLDTRTRPAQAIRLVREELARDLGAEWGGLSAQQR